MRTSSAPANVTSKTIDSVALQDLFGSKIPVSVKSFVYNLAKLGAELNDPHLDTVEIIYSAVVRELNYRQRKLLFSFVVQEVEFQRLNAASLLVFSRFEPNHYIVCQSVWSYLLNRQAPLDNPMLATQELLAVMNEYQPLNRGAFFAGLVCFGDRKVCAAARMIRHSITGNESRDFSTAVTAPLQRATLDFCLGWLVELVNNNKHEVAMQVAYALSSIVIKDSDAVVYDRDQQFGPYAFKASTTLPETSWNDWLIEYSPILDTLGLVGKPVINQMLEIFEEPTSSTLEQLERRKESSRRKAAERRASDRRIVNISPILERRSENRRNDERRMQARRT